ncbi:MAG TPA: pitrilysin family protein [Terriglobales bacterium]|nr:pitrilysin family protein [Terriglobales bacterium]
MRAAVRQSAVMAFLFLSFAMWAEAQDVASFEKRVTVKQLKNGLTVLLMERPEAPVFSFHIMVDAGSVQDPKGGSGLAHMFEHMAFKGTQVIGTKDWAKEKVVLADLEKAYHAYDVEKRKLIGRDEKKVKELEAKWRALQDQAEEFVIQDEFSEIVENAGGVGLNASTGADETRYFYSLPANQTELWAYLESERFIRPIYRQFYKERDVVLEERRLRTDSSPIGRLIEQLGAAAFTAHPYQVSGVGWQSEISSVTATQADEFFKTYYRPSNMVLAVVGAIKAAEIIPLIERYFGRVPAGPKPPEINTIEPEQIGERSVVIREASQPWYIECYKRPGYNDPDDAVYDAISEILSSGRTSRMYRSLVRDKKIALTAAGQSGFPGTKYPNLFLFYAIPSQGKTPADVQAAIREEIEKLKNEDVSDDELNRIKTNAKADLLRGLADNQGLAIQLATAQVRYGDWREIFREVERIDKVSKADIRRVANKTFVPNKRTVGMIENVAPVAKGGK